MTQATFANHCHLMPSGPWGRRADAAALLAHLDALEIDRAVAFAPYADSFDGDAARANAWLIEQVTSSDRLVPFATIDPTAEGAVALLEQLHAGGVRGCKLHPSVQRFDVADPRARDYFHACSELGVLVAIHTGPAHSRPLALDDPVKLDALLFEVPRLRMVLEHMGGRLWYETALAIAVNHGGRVPRAYLGVTSNLERPDHVMSYLGPERVAEAVAAVGGRQIVFGLDFPYWTVDDGRRALDALQQLPIPPSERARVLGGTLRRLLGA